MFKFIQSILEKRIAPVASQLEALSFSISQLQEQVTSLSERAKTSAALSSDLSKKLQAQLQVETLIAQLKDIQEKSAGIDESDFNQLAGKLSVIATLLRPESKK